MRRYSVEDVADRIAEQLGERPTTNQIYKGVSAAGAPRGRSVRLSVVAGLPAPVERPSEVSRAALSWDADDIERWLADHPRVRMQKALDELAARADALAESGRRAGEIAMVEWARSQGLSWAQIAAALSKARGAPVTRQAVAQRYARLSV